MTDNQKLRKAYSLAGTRLREAHREEFNEYQKEAAEELGLEWNPRPSGTDRAKAEIERMLDEQPELAEVLVVLLAGRAAETE